MPMIELQSRSARSSSSNKSRKVISEYDLNSSIQHPKILQFTRRLIILVTGRHVEHDILPPKQMTEHVVNLSVYLARDSNGPRIKYIQSD